MRKVVAVANCRVPRSWPVAPSEVKPGAPRGPGWFPPVRDGVMDRRSNDREAERHTKGSTGRTDHSFDQVWLDLEELVKRE